MYGCDITEVRYTNIGNNVHVRASITKQGATFKSVVASLELEVYDGHQMNKDQLKERIIKVYTDSLEGE
jgi:hypothetical protein